MKEIDANGNIRLSRGDTLSFTVTAKKYDFGENDRALYTVKSSSGEIVYQNIYTMVDNVFRVDFLNSMTKKWLPGTYSYDVRYSVNAVIEDGKLVGGDNVDTPSLAKTITILPVVGEI